MALLAEIIACKQHMRCRGRNVLAHQPGSIKEPSQFGGLPVSHLLRAAVRLLPIAFVSACPGVAMAAHVVTVLSQKQGSTPFIEIVRLHVSDVSTFTGVQFTVAPKSGSFTRPISATYSAAYLMASGYWDGTSPDMNVPVFGLYASASNMVMLNFNFSDTPSVQQPDTIATAAYNDSCNVTNNKTVVVQARKATSDISFDYFLLKKYCSNDSPTIMDTDGEVRWVGDAQTASLASIFFQNKIYLGSGASVKQLSLDGRHGVLAFYKDMGITSTTHHNFDPGRTGFIMDVNTTTETEAVNVEIDTSGQVLNTWDFGQIISKAMTAGGDDPAKFTAPVGTDWFHNNATTYNPSDNTLIVSSRENFVIAVDYDTQEIKWILGDPTKHWHQFASLRKFALTTKTHYPIGQHAVSLNHNGDLLLFDDGLNSMYQVPPGRKRTYSAPRAYHIDTATMTATEVFSYPQQENIYSPICSSVYEDAPNNFMIDYAVSQNYTVMELVGLSNGKQKVFDYQFPAINYCGAGWNAEIVHLEDLHF